MMSASVQALLEEITNKYSIAFSYEPTEMNLTRRIKLSNKSTTLNNALTEIFRNTDIEFRVHANVIILRKAKTDAPKRKK